MSPAGRTALRHRWCTLAVYASTSIDAATKGYDMLTRVAISIVKASRIDRYLREQTP
jgi:hypothetical protein